MRAWSCPRLPHLLNLIISSVTAIPAAAAQRRDPASRTRLGRGIHPVARLPAAVVPHRLGSRRHRVVRHIAAAAAAAAADVLLLLRMVLVVRHMVVVVVGLARIGLVAFVRTVFVGEDNHPGGAAAGRRMGRGKNRIGCRLAVVGIPMRREEEGIGLAVPAADGMAAGCSHLVVGRRAWSHLSCCSVMPGCRCCSNGRLKGVGLVAGIGCRRWRGRCWIGAGCHRSTAAIGDWVRGCSCRWNCRVGRMLAGLHPCSRRRWRSGRWGCSRSCCCSAGCCQRRFAG